ncbi:MAG: LPS assembly lipoprotein LptE [Myxococcota bacterium]
MRLRLVVLLAPVLLACGFRPVDASGVFGPDVRRIEIRPFDNPTAEPGFERLLGDSLVEEFARRAVLEPLYGARTSDGTRADLILQGEVTELEIVPSAFSSVALTVEDTVIVHLDVEVLRSATGRRIWGWRDLTLAERFAASPDPQTYRSNKKQALLRLTAELAARIHDGLFEAF